MERVLTLNEVGEMIRVPTATLRYWRQRGTGRKSFKMDPRRVMYRSVTFFSGSMLNMLGVRCPRPEPRLLHRCCRWEPLAAEQTSSGTAAAEMVEVGHGQHPEA